MIKKIQILFCVLPILFILNSCFYIVSDKPYYYSDYEDPETSISYNYYYSYSYSSYPAYVPIYTPTPAPTPIIKQQTNIYIILKVVDNRHIFYRNNRKIAVWYFHPDGRIERKGENISGKVIRYYNNSDIIEWEFEYKNNVRWGLCKRYYNSGGIWEEVYYNNGKREGPYKLYHPSGKVKEEINYKDGFREGTYRIYHEDGQVIELGNYKKNNKEVKFRDEKYFKELKDKRDEVIPGPTSQANIIQTPVQQMKEQLTTTIINDLFKDKGFLGEQMTPQLIKDNEEEKEKTKNIIQGQKQEQAQEIIEQKVDVMQATTYSQAEQKIKKVKKTKDKKQFKVEYDFGLGKRSESSPDFNKSENMIQSISENASQEITEETNTKNYKKDKEIKYEQQNEQGDTGNSFKQEKKKRPFSIEQ